MERHLAPARETQLRRSTRGLTSSGGAVGATPVATAGFLERYLERYKEAGGSEVGCGSSLSGLLLSCLAGQGRRRR